jgi:hypothetical protein
VAPTKLKAVEEHHEKRVNGFRFGSRIDLASFGGLVVFFKPNRTASQID